MILLEKAIGDAYGLGFEFAPPEKFAQNDLTAYLPHGLHPITPGCYSDDTQMALAVAEVVLEKGYKATREDFAEAFVRAFKRDPRLGYARGFHGLLTEVTDGADLLAKIKPASTRGGAAMRAAPLGVMHDIGAVQHLAEVQARITHDTPQGVKSAVAVATATFYAISGGPKESLRYILAMMDLVWATEHDGSPVTEDGIVIVNAALTAVERGNSLSEVLRMAVGFMGDTDTVAAIAMAIASVFPCMVNDLPTHLYEGLENGVYGRDHLMEMDRRLRAFC